METTNRQNWDLKPPSSTGNSVILAATPGGLQPGGGLEQKCDGESPQMGAVGEPTAVGLGGQTLRSIAMLDE